MVKSDIEKKLDSFEKRIERLEKTVFNEKEKPKKSSNEYKGLVGGVNFLIDNNYFKKLVSASEVHEELKKEGYVYPKESVDKILRHDFVLKKKILNRIDEGGIWKYALRK